MKIFLGDSIGLRQGRRTLLVRHRQRVLFARSESLLPLGRILAARRARRKNAAPLAAARHRLVDADAIVARVFIGVTKAAHLVGLEVTRRSRGAAAHRRSEALSAREPQ